MTKYNNPRYSWKTLLNLSNLVDRIYRAVFPRSTKSPAEDTDKVVVEDVDEVRHYVYLSDIGTGGGSSISFGAQGEIPYVNATSDDFDYLTNFSFDGTDLSAPNALKVDQINEFTTDAGVTIDGLEIKDYNITAPDGSSSDGQSIGIYGGDADGATNDGGHVYIRGGNAILADNQSLTGNIYLSPGSPFTQYSSAPRVYIGDPNYDGRYSVIQAEGSGSDVTLQLLPKGTGSVILGIDSTPSISLITPTINLGSLEDVVVQPSGAGGLQSDGYKITLRGGNGLGVGDTDGGDLCFVGGNPNDSGSRGNIYLGTGGDNTVPAKTSETNVIYYNTGTGKLSYGAAGEGGTPMYIYIKATGQSEGDLHLSDVTNWGVSFALIKEIRVVTNSTDWDLHILQNDNGYSANDANIPSQVLNVGGNGTEIIMLDYTYEDEDATDEVHLYWVDNSGSNTADIYVTGYELNGN
jgi:hypothetical protein